MLIEERLEKIKEIIKEQNTATIEYLAEQLQVSKDTIRRDLIKLENKNVVKRIHGGAILSSREALIFDYNQRSSTFHDIKEKIAKKASELINENDTVIFDSSTTVEAVIPYLDGKSIYSITNSLTHAILLAKNFNPKITVVSGKLHNEQLFMYGAETVKKLSQYCVDVTLLGVFAISANGLFIHTEEEGLVKREMIQHSQKVIALADHTKIDTTGFFKICQLSDIDILIVDQTPPTDFCLALEEHGVDLFITD